MKQGITNAMKAVLHWMYSYDGVMIQAVDDNDWPMWTASWANDEAKKHMEMVMDDLMGLSNEIKIKRDKRISQGTPKLSKPTFKGLLARGLIKATKRRVPRRGWSNMLYYQLTEEGRAEVTGLRLVQKEVA
jgi:hypothetical protein